MRSSLCAILPDCLYRSFCHKGYRVFRLTFPMARVVDPLSSVKMHTSVVCLL